MIHMGKNDDVAVQIAANMLKLIFAKYFIYYFLREVGKHLDKTGK
jgi:hypothetical protein